MAYDLWDAGKDFLGALGPLLISVPWFYDFHLRRRRRVASDVPVGNEALRQLLRDIESRLRDRIETPRVSDVCWTAAGLACIFLSFVIALAHGLAG